MSETVNLSGKTALVTVAKLLPILLRRRVPMLLSIIIRINDGRKKCRFKSGIIGLTRYYASQLVKSGITANAMAPALIETDMLRNAEPDPNILPVGRFGKVEEISSVVELLAKNSFVTDQVISANGGLYF